jgi:hypothetical protein
MAMHNGLSPFFVGDQKHHGGDGMDPVHPDGLGLLGVVSSSSSRDRLFPKKLRLTKIKNMQQPKSIPPPPYRIDELAGLAKNLA